MYAAFNSLAQFPAPGPRHGHTLRVIAATVGGAITLLAFGGEAARAAEGPPSKRVSYADLNLRSPAGREALVRRVRFAAKQVCYQSTYQSTMPFWQDRKCIKATMTTAMSQVDRAVVLAQLSQ